MADSVKVNNKAFLQQKRTNFVNFLVSALQDVSVDVLDDGRYEIMLADLNKINDISIDEFLKFILFKVSPHVNNLDIPLDQFFIEHGLDRNLFTAAHITRVKLYLQCFIEVINA